MAHRDDLPIPDYDQLPLTELRHRVRSLDDGQLKTLRYEDMVRSPGSAATALSEFTGTTVAAPVSANRKFRHEGNDWRRLLSASQVADVERAAGEELRRLGYQ